MEKYKLKASELQIRTGKNTDFFIGGRNGLDGNAGNDTGSMHLAAGFTDLAD